MHFLCRDNCNLALDMDFSDGSHSFKLRGIIGDGAAGLVRKAERNDDKKFYAIKFLAPDPKYLEVSSFDDVAARFKREGERGLALNHPNLVRIYAYVENKNGEAFACHSVKNPFIVMEYIPGKTLESFIKNCKTGKVFDTSREKLSIAIQLCKAVEYLHELRIIHRDIKPGNVFYSHNKIKHGDFGVTKWQDFHSSLTTGTLTATHHKGLGTMKYMPPEQAIRPKDVTTRSDIYSLGITLFELYTGQILASPHHVTEIMMARLSRGTTQSRYFQMGYTVEAYQELLAGAILDSVLRGTKDRPKIDVIRGITENIHDKLYQPEDDEDF